MYSQATLDKYHERALEAIARARASHDPLQVCISVGNVKVGRILNVSLMSRICCGNCRLCEHYCYDIKAALQYGNVMNARARNTVLAQDDLEEFFRQIVARLTERRKRKYFRFHVGGDIISEAYLRKMCETAEAKPTWKFWTYTKMFETVNGYVRKGGLIPSNLTILYSADKNAVVDNPFGFPIAYTVLEGDTPPEGYFKCPGNCEMCIEMERGCPFGGSVWFGIH